MGSYTNLSQLNDLEQSKLLEKLPPAQKELDMGLRALTLSFVTSYSAAQAGRPAAF